MADWGEGQHLWPEVWFATDIAAPDVQERGSSQNMVVAALFFGKEKTNKTDTLVTWVLLPKPRLLFRCQNVQLATKEQLMTLMT